MIGWKIQLFSETFVEFLSLSAVLFSFGGPKAWTSFTASVCPSKIVLILPNYYDK